MCSECQTDVTRLFAMLCRLAADVLNTAGQMTYKVICAEDNKPRLTELCVCRLSMLGINPRDAQDCARWRKASRRKVNPAESGNTAVKR